MSLSNVSDRRFSQPFPWSRDYHQSFIKHVHELLAEGYAQLDRSACQREVEEVISGFLVDAINQWLNAYEAPDWTRHYFVAPERPESGADQVGKKRPRIDIYVESSELRPRASFAFEAKRLYRSDSVAQYVGQEGLGAFLDGAYTPDAASGGMLGYVQSDSVDELVEKVRTKLDSERAFFGLTTSGPTWMGRTYDERIGLTWLSTHIRHSTGAAITIYHSFLDVREEA